MPSAKSVAGSEPNWAGLHACTSRRRRRLPACRPPPARRPARPPATAAPHKDVSSASQPDNDPSDIPVPRLSYATVRPGGGAATAAPPAHTPPPWSAAVIADGPMAVSASNLLGLRLGQPGFSNRDPLANAPPRRRALPQRQLEELADEVLSADSSVWSADARNQPASTSARSAEGHAAFLHGKTPTEIAVRIDELSSGGDLDGALGVLQACIGKPFCEDVAVRCAAKTAMAS